MPLAAFSCWKPAGFKQAAAVAPSMWSAMKACASRTLPALRVMAQQLKPGQCAPAGNDHSRHRMAVGEQFELLSAVIRHQHCLVPDERSADSSGCV